MAQPRVGPAKRRMPDPKRPSAARGLPRWVWGMGRRARAWAEQGDEGSFHQSILNESMYERILVLTFQVSHKMRRQIWPPPIPNVNIVCKEILFHSHVLFHFQPTENISPLPPSQTIANSYINLLFWSKGLKIHAKVLCFVTLVAGFACCFFFNESFQTHLKYLSLSFRKKYIESELEATRRWSHKWGFLKTPLEVKLNGT